MSHSSRVKQLLAELLEDRQLLLSVQAILVAQHQAILSYDQPALDTLNQQLMGAYHQLHQHAQQRLDSLSQLGLPVNAQGMGQLLAELPGHLREPVQATWQTVLELLEKCRQSNRHNQQLTEMQYDILQDALPWQEQADYWLYQPEHRR